MNYVVQGLIASVLLVLSAETQVLSGDASLGLKLSSQKPLSQRPTPKPKPKPPSQRLSCPKEVEALTALLIRDLPNYANRTIQRASSRTKIAGYYTSVIVAGRPEFKPLTLGPGPYQPTSEAAKHSEPRQLFLTTLERQYTNNKAIELQQYHWLFLAQTTDGWRLVMMYSQIGSYPAGEPPSPPRESSNGIFGQAIRSWLEDCRAGAIKPLPETPIPQK